MAMLMSLPQTNQSSCVLQIGETAGLIWQVLNAKGPLTVAKLVKEIEAPRDVVMQALGWLAREDKISIDEEARTRVVTLKE
ncbi:MAG: winged helix-turn-helix domain-containing protein [Planctomycetota bacterium]|nr:winged helix-turn-helix domain-containing protein [Planctomycetota bacterium]